MSLEKLCRLLEDFKFDQAVNYITTNKGGVLDTKDAIYILCQLCKIIPKSEGKKLNSADIFNLAVLCCKNVHSMNEKEIGNFLITVYHVIKHLFLQVRFLYLTFARNNNHKINSTHYGNTI